MSDVYLQNLRVNIVSGDISFAHALAVLSWLILIIFEAYIHLFHIFLSQLIVEHSTMSCSAVALSAPRQRYGVHSYPLPTDHIPGVFVLVMYSELSNTHQLGTPPTRPAGDVS